MKIIILGAGQVGGTLAENLANERNDITVIDTDAERLRELGDRLDIGTVRGMGCYPAVLKEAGAGKLPVAVSGVTSRTESKAREFLATLAQHTDLQCPRRIEYGSLSLSQMYTDIYGVRGI